MYYRVEYIPNVNNATIKVKKFKTLGALAKFIELLEEHGELLYAGRRSE